MRAAVAFAADHRFAGAGGVGRIIGFGSTSIFAKALSKNDFERELVGKLTKAESDTAERCREKNIHWDDP